MHYSTSLWRCAQHLYKYMTRFSHLSAYPEHHNRMSMSITIISDKVNHMSMWIIKCFQLHFYSLWNNSLKPCGFWKKTIYCLWWLFNVSGMAAQSLFVLQDYTKKMTLCNTAVGARSQWHLWIRHRQLKQLWFPTIPGRTANFLVLWISS